MKLKQSKVLRTVAALSALTAGAVVTVALTSGAHPAAIGLAGAPVGPSASISAPAAGSPAGTAPPTAAGSPQASASAGRATPAPSGSTAGSGVAPKTVAAPPAPLPAAQLPDSAAAKWKPIAPPHTQPVHHSLQLNECASVDGAATWQQQGYVSSFDTPAIQDSFTFADAPAAQSAFRAVLTAMDGCQAKSTAVQTASKITPDALVTRTATTTDGIAYNRQWTGVAPISAPGRQTDHFYAVQRGSVLTVLQYAVPAATAGATPQTPDDDQKQLAVIEAQLTTSTGS